MDGHPKDIGGKQEGFRFAVDRARGGRVQMTIQSVLVRKLRGRRGLGREAAQAHPPEEDENEGGGDHLPGGRWGF